MKSERDTLKPARESVILTIVDEGDPHAVTESMRRPFGQRLRAALKSMLRRDGLRCRAIADGEKVEVRILQQVGVKECQ